MTPNLSISMASYSAVSCSVSSEMPFVPRKDTNHDKA